MDPFRGKTAIVTGAASGIGRALCEALAAGGATVIAADVNAEGAESVAHAMRSAGGNGRAAVLDVTRAEDVKQLVVDTITTDRRLDFMFNNAGIAIAGEVQDMTLAHWERILSINLNGVVYGTAAAYPRMIAQRSGHIVNTASLAGLTPVGATVAYAATKHAVVGLSASLRTEAAAYGVRVSVACPGFVATEIFRNAQYLRGSADDVLAMLSLVRPITASQCAQAILRGVARNQAIITVPFAAHLGWWLYRLSPALWLRLASVGMKQYRRRTKRG